MPGTISQAKRQQSLLNSGYLDLSGSQKFEFAPISFDELADTLAELAVDYQVTAGNKLNQLHKVATGALIDSIVPTEVTIMGKVLTVGIKVADYYKFVDKGVKGWAGGGGNSPYQFKKFTGKSGSKNSAMITALRVWIIKEGLKGRGAENRKPITVRESKRNAIKDTSLSTAIAISRAIRKRGLPTSNFWTDTATEIGRKAKVNFGKAFKTDVINNLTNLS